MRKCDYTHVCALFIFRDKLVRRGKIPWKIFGQISPGSCAKSSQFDSNSIRFDSINPRSQLTKLSKKKKKKRKKAIAGISGKWASCIGEYFLEAACDRWRGAIFARGKYISLFNFAGGAISEGKREIDSRCEREREREVQHPLGPSHENVESLTVSATVSLLSPLFVFDVSPRPRLPCGRCISAPDRSQLDGNRPSLQDFQLGAPGQIKSSECINFLSVCAARATPMTSRDPLSRILFQVLNKFFVGVLLLQFAPCFYCIFVLRSSGWNCFVLFSQGRGKIWFFLCN